ncbi:hypothetical protein [Tindallia californiensis]|nr:hypothetical protein [Tindallia californiensis]
MNSKIVIGLLICFSVFFISGCDKEISTDAPGNSQYSQEELSDLPENPISDSGYSYLDLDMGHVVIVDEAFEMAQDLEENLKNPDFSWEVFVASFGFRELKPLSSGAIITENVEMGVDQVPVFTGIIFEDVDGNVYGVRNNFEEVRLFSLPSFAKNDVDTLIAFSDLVDTGDTALLEEFYELIRYYHYANMSQTAKNISSINDSSVAVGFYLEKDRNAPYRLGMPEEIMSPIIVFHDLEEKMSFSLRFSAHFGKYINTYYADRGKERYENHVRFQPGELDFKKHLLEMGFVLDPYAPVYPDPIVRKWDDAGAEDESVYYVYDEETDIFHLTDLAFEKAEKLSWEQFSKDVPRELFLAAAGIEAFSGRTSLNFTLSFSGYRDSHEYDFLWRPTKINYFDEDGNPYLLILDPDQFRQIELPRAYNDDEYIGKLFQMLVDSPQGAPHVMEELYEYRQMKHLIQDKLEHSMDQRFRYLEPGYPPVLEHGFIDRFINHDGEESIRLVLDRGLGVVSRRDARGLGSGGGSPCTSIRPLDLERYDIISPVYSIDSNGKIYVLYTMNEDGALVRIEE